VIKTGEFTRNLTNDQIVTPLQDFIWSVGDDLKFSSALLNSTIQEKISNFALASKDLSVNEAVDSFTDILTSA
jgi:hypothetical protein